MFEIAFSRKAAKFLSNFPDKDFNILIDKIELLRLNPYRRDLDIVKMEGKENAYRLRSGKIRLLYTIIKDKILIYFFDAGYRKDIYK